MTATEELRRLLDERGVKYVGTHPAFTAWWGKHDLYCSAMEVYDGELDLGTNMSNVTPEQAIAATLGRGTCHDNGGTDENDQQVFECDACGCLLSLYDRDGVNNLCTSFIYDYPRFCPACGRKVVTSEQTERRLHD